MYLTRLTLDARDGTARGDLSDLHRLHRRLMSAFPSELGGEARSAAGLLYRVESLGEYPVVLVQSALRPDWGALPDGWLGPREDGTDAAAVRNLAATWSALSVGNVLRFRLLANAARKIDTLSRNGVRSNGRRVPLRTEESALAWLERKALRAGFTLVRSETFPDRPDVAATPQGRARGSREGKEVTFEGVLFEGRLCVDDVELFATALRQGLGPGKAFGFGLLSVMRQP